MVEHVGSANDRRVRRAAAPLLQPEGGCSTTASPRCATRSRGRAVLRALRLPRRRAAARVAASLAVERAGLVDRSTSRAFQSTTPRPAPLGDAPRRETSTGGDRARRTRARPHLALYLRAARNGFLTSFTSIYQIRAAPPASCSPRSVTESATVSA
jgi:hypothetical protein